MSGDRERFTLIFHDPERPEAQDAGSWAIASDGRISEIVAAPGFEAYLAAAAAKLNAASSLHVQGEPEDEAIPGAMYLRTVRRGDLNFGDAMREELAKYYALELRPG